jgi:glycosyltransferase involved in cell wall biosynthesis
MIYLHMPLGAAHGWGVCGKYLTRELAKIEPVRLITKPFEAGAIGDALEFYELQRVFWRAPEALNTVPGSGPGMLDGPLVQYVADQTLAPPPPQLRGQPTLGYTFFEHNLIEPAWVENGRRCFDRLVTGSTWCTNLLTASGLAGVATVIQGIDPVVFHPPACPEESREFFGGKFVVFSGGKFELRKGQDIVIRAYKVLQDRHADVMLVNAWYNPWPASIETMRASPLIRLALQNGPYVQVINRILADNGIDVSRVVTCPPQPNSAMARLYRNTDVGLFPNRCEGGTNLVLMEYMACGKPVIAVNTTGHADIVNAANARILMTKGDQTINRNQRPIARWPEPDLDDAIAQLEWAYQNRDPLGLLGRQAGLDLARRTWRQTAVDFLDVIRRTGSGGAC